MQVSLQAEGWGILHGRCGPQCCRSPAQDSAFGLQAQTPATHSPQGLSPTPSPTPESSHQHCTMIRKGCGAARTQLPGLTQTPYASDLDFQRPQKIPGREPANSRRQAAAVDAGRRSVRLRAHSTPSMQQPHGTPGLPAVPGGCVPHTMGCTRLQNDSQESTTALCPSPDQDCLGMRAELAAWPQKSSGAHSNPPDPRGLLPSHSNQLPSSPLWMPF